MKVLIIGASMAAFIGCAAGAFCRPNIEAPKPGQTLVVTSPEQFDMPRGYVDLTAEL